MEGNLLDDASKVKIFSIRRMAELIAGYLKKEGKKELSLRARSLIPEISEFYRRDEEKE